MRQTAAHGRPAASVAARRLLAQQITRSAFSAPVDVVAWLGAVQAQDYSAAKWAVGLRLPDGATTDMSIERSLSDGAILRTHALRRTWQLVSSADLRWLLGLVAPRLISRFATRYQQLGLDAAAFRHSAVAIAKSLEEGRALTRDELGVVLELAGLSATGPRLSHLLAHAELEALICSGPRRGNQATYLLLDRLVPVPRAPVERDEALAKLAQRYFRSRGPATLRDFAWWSGLTTHDARAGLDAVKSTLVSEVADGQTTWHSDEAPVTVASPCAHLLPAFDEYLIAYRDRDAVLDPSHARHLNAGGGMLSPCIVIDGRVVGTWRRTLSRGTVALDLDMFGPATPRERQAVAGAARRYGEFLRLDVRLGVTARGR